MSTKSIVKEIRTTITQLDELLDSTDIKDSRRVTALSEKSRLLAGLLQQENADKQGGNEAKIDELTAQHDNDRRRIVELEAENVALRSKPEVVRHVPDPEHATVRQQNDELTSVIKLLVQGMSEDERAVHAISAIQTLSPDAARRLCDLAQLSYREYVQMSRQSNHELQDVISKAQIAGPAVIFARAALAMRGVGTRDQLEDWR